MQLLGQNLETNFVRPFLLKRPDGSTLTFQLSPLPLGFQSRLRQQGLTLPVPPVKISRDSSGIPLRDRNALAITQPDTQNTDYLNNVEIYHQRVALLAIVESLRNDTNVQFATPKPTTNLNQQHAWLEFADAIFNELEAAAFTVGDLIAFCDEICRISNMVDQHTLESQSNFSLPRRGNST